MHDLRWIRQNPEAFDVGMAARGLTPQAAAILDLDSRRRAVQTETQEVQARRNELSKQVGKIKSSGGSAEAEIAEVAALKQKLADGEEEEKRLAAALSELLAGLPNVPDATVPAGADETANVELRRVGTPRTFNFAPKQHFELGEALGQMDFETAAKLSGARFVVLSRHLARLERALAAFMLDIHTGEFGYTECAVPLLVRPHTAYGTGNLPKFAEDLFHTTDDFYLIPTAEMVLTNLVREQIVEPERLPIRVTAWTPCFRSEAGAAGKDTRGMIRQHQFTKVELVSITDAAQSDDELARMTGCAETILQRLELPYRVLQLCGGDMGFSARRTYDLEVWLPGQDAYREISSCSNCGDFQARRMDARTRVPGQKGTQFVHTLNGSGLAVGRTLIAVLENYQQADGTIAVPAALRGYMGGLEVIGSE